MSILEQQLADAPRFPSLQVAADCSKLHQALTVMLRHAALRIARPPVGARLARPAASRQKLALRPGAGVARRVATARPTRPLMLPKAPRLLACRAAAARPLSSNPPPLEEEEKALVKVAKKLKKNNVSIDLVSFGDEASEINATKLGAFLQAVNSNDSSHLVTIPPGTGVLSDVLLSTPVFMGDEDGGGGGGMGGVGTSAGGGGASDFEFGVDPNLDPDLALALRVSMEEERARQEAQAQRERENQEGGQKEEATPAQPQAPVEMEAETKKVEENDETILQQALAMSLAPEDPITPSGAGGSKDQEAKTPGSGSSGLGAMLEDKSFVTNVLSNLPGVDVSDVNVQQVLSALKEKQSPKRSRTSDDDDDDEGGADEDEK